MADENIERRMEFILKQQALVTAKMGQLEDLVVRFAQATLDRFEATDERVDDIDEKIAALFDSQLRSQERGRDIDERISALVDSQVRTEENVKKTEENVKKTDEALRSLIALVDRYFSEGRNGNSTG